MTATTLVKKLSFLLLFVVAAIAKTFASTPVAFHKADPPIITISVDDAKPCAGTPEVTVTAKVTNAGAYPNYLWKVNGVVTGENSAVLKIVNGKGALNITCTATNTANLLSTTSDNLMVTYLNNISANVQIYYITNTNNTIDQNFCEGQEVTIGSLYTFDRPDRSELYVSFQWLVNGVLVSAGGNGGFTSTSLKDGDVITTRITFSGKCVVGKQAVSNTLSPHIIPGVYPLVTIAADDPDVCSAGSKNYTATVQNAGDKPQYQWMVNGQNVGTNAASFNAASLSTGDKLTCMVTGKNSCGTGSKVSNELVIPQTIPSIDNSVAISSSLKNNVITEGQQITFTAVAAYTTGISYQWLVNGLSVGTNSATFTSSDLTNGDVVTCQVTTSGQCVVKPVITSNALTVLMLTPIVIPNAFTPNGDGVNDTWDIKALLAYVGCTIDIYNRYGTQVYHTLNYTSGWDGSAKGKRLPAGTYYYLINPNDGTGKLSGSVTILR